jgi:hypothetical protein
MRGIEVGPEEGEQRIAAVKAPGLGGGEVRQQRQALGLRQHGGRPGAVRAAEIEGAEGMEVEHTPI